MTIKETLQKHDFTFKKKFGQNFITDPHLLAKIVDAAQVTADDIVVEIGPGAATLTHALAQKAKHVIAIEIDQTLLPIIEEAMADCPNFHLHCADALTVDLDQLVAATVGAACRYKVVANLPYYITTPLIMHFLEQNFAIDRITIMVQKEVAQRFQAAPGGKDYGAITAMLNYYGSVRLAFVVPRQMFIPQPDVDSAVVDIALWPQKPVTVSDENLLRRLVKAAFGQRRKTLANALKTIGYDQNCLLEAMHQAQIDPKRRGETLSIAEFAALSDGLSALSRDC